MFCLGVSLGGFNAVLQEVSKQAATVCWESRCRVAATPQHKCIHVYKPHLHTQLLLSSAIPIQNDYQQQTLCHNAPVIISTEPSRPCSTLTDPRRRPNPPGYQHTTPTHSPTKCLHLLRVHSNLHKSSSQRVRLIQAKQGDAAFPKVPNIFPWLPTGGTCCNSMPRWPPSLSSHPQYNLKRANAGSEPETTSSSTTVLR